MVTCSTSYSGEPKRPGAVFDVGLHQLAQPFAGGQRLGRPVDANHRVPPFAQMPQVAPCAAGNVQHSAVGSDQVAPAPHPFRRGLCTVRTVHTVHTVH